MKKEEVSVPDELVMHKIYLIRGNKVMLDKDLAELYGVETKRLKEQVKRNKERFPEQYMFGLTESEFGGLKQQYAAAGWGGTRYLHIVFTEHGVLHIHTRLLVQTAYRHYPHQSRIAY